MVIMTGGVSLCCPGWGAVARYQLTTASASRAQRFSYLSLPEWLLSPSGHLSPAAVGTLESEHSLALSARLECSGSVLQPLPLGSSDSPASASSVIDACLFLVEMRFHHVGQAGLEILTL
ncbi:hypothetical protein AAY473_001876 [Plecturocebus cupreus]